MKAQLLEVNLNAKKTSGAGKELTGISLKYQPAPYKGQVKDPTERFIFTNNPIAPALKNGDVKVGDWVEIGFDQSKFKNPESIKKSSPPAPDTPPAKKSGGYNDEATQLRIARSVAFKGATELIAAGYGESKKTSKNEVLAEEVIALSKTFEAYLNMQEVDSTIESSISDVKSEGGGEYEQESFDQS